MKKTNFIVILIGLILTLSIIPAVNAVGEIAFVSPPGETYKRGDTLTVRVAT